MAKKQAQNPAVIDNAPVATIGTDLTKAVAVAPTMVFGSELLNPIFATMHHEIDGAKTPDEIATAASKFYRQSEGLQSQVRKQLYLEICMRVTKEPEATRDEYAGKVADGMKKILVLADVKGADARASELRSFTKAYRINPKATTALFETEGYTSMIEKARKLTEATTTTPRNNGGGGSGNKEPKQAWVDKVCERIVKACTIEQCLEIVANCEKRMEMSKLKHTRKGVTANVIDNATQK